MFSYVGQSNRKDRVQELNDLSGIALSRATALDNKIWKMLFLYQ